MKKRRLIIAIAMLLSVMTAAMAQCKFQNTAFKSGEHLTYNLYFNWKFVWVKVGSASMSTVENHYNGKPAYRASLITRTSSKADKFFIMRDTLLCYTTTQLEPLYFRKGAQEGKRYTVDEAFYSYPSADKVHIRQHRLRHNGENVYREWTRAECTYDMLSIFLRARSFNPESWKKGTRVNFPITDGTHITPALIEYKGKTTIKADNGVKYRCLQLSYMEQDGKKYKELVRFYVTDDSNHVPVRLDMFLKFGSAKAFLVGAKGVRGQMTSIVNK